MSLDQLPLLTKSLLIRKFVPEDARDMFLLSNEEIVRAGLGITSARNIASQRTLERARFSHKEDRVMMYQGTEELARIYVLSAG